MLKLSKLLLYLILAPLVLTYCMIPPTSNPPPVPAYVTDTSTQIAPINTVTPEPPAPTVLTICLGQEPTSLFLYADASVGARSVREAIYDGPYDILGFDMVPVILTSKPSLTGGQARPEAVSVEEGDIIVDYTGALVNLSPETVYLPAGCSDESCAETYQGGEMVQIDQLVVSFELLPGIQWSDGALLKASDSVYSYQVAKDLFPRFWPELIQHTASYLALDDSTIEWRGVPGYIDATYYTNFFSPLPQHMWGGLPSAQLLDAEIATRSPLGWGPYVIDQWVAGDHISLSRNEDYFRGSEGLPLFDRLVFRFVDDGVEAIAALQAGECDFVDETVPLVTVQADIAQLQEDEQLKISYETGTAWEHADFGISPSNPEIRSLFQDVQIRQAIAMCIDRERMAVELFSGQSSPLESYAPPTHPLSNPDARLPEYDPQAAADLLQAIGWIDDGDPATPRVANGIPGIDDGTQLSIPYIYVSGGERELTAQMLKEFLAECGVRLELEGGSMDAVFAPGPQGPIFGRNFDMAQFGWVTSLEPPCFIYTSAEIPGPYPDYAKGWGGANAVGYSDPEFDRACRKARFSLPDSPEHQAAHYQAQAIFVRDLPVVPLYLGIKQVVMRPDMCGVILDSSSSSALWNLEAFDYGEACWRDE